MAIFRGIGGAGDSTTDASLTAITEQSINAANSATSASTSASNAAVSASQAATSATNAASSETAAATSETNAAASEIAAAASETAAAASETAAAASATIATTKAAEAVVSAANAASSAASILGAEANTAASALAAAASETAAALSESNAAESAANSANSATASASSATASAASATAAAASEAAAAASFDSFDDRYLGAKTGNPSFDNDGNDLLVGALYYDSTNNVMKVFSGTAWVAAYASASGALQDVNNLADVSNINSARNNLGLGVTSDVVFNSLETTNGLIVGGDLTINGTLTTVNTENLAVADNMIYLNEGSTVTNPDLGWSGNYNDGTYAHTGIFRDATDGVFKFYDGYTPEPGVEINTGHASFSLADVQAGTFFGILSGNASTATSLETSRTISLTGDVSGSASFNGTADATITAVVADDSHSHTTATITGLDTALASYAPLASPALTGTPTVPTAATNTNTTQAASTAFVVAQIAEDAPTKAGTGASGTWDISVTGSSASTTGNAATSTTLETARTINGVSFDGSADIMVEPYVEDAVATSVTRYVTFVDDSVPGYKRLNEDANFSYNPGTNVLSVPTFSGALSGNATTATTLQTARTINGVSFNGSANITAEPYVERDDSTNATRYPVFVDNSTAGYKRLNMDASWGYNPSSNVLIVSNVGPSSTTYTSSTNIAYGASKAWVNFNGIGTPAIRHSHNVSSISDLGVGKFRANFTSALSNSSYCVTALGHSTGDTTLRGAHLSSLATTSVTCHYQNGINTSYYDATYHMIAVFSK